MDNIWLCDVIRYLQAEKGFGSLGHSSWHGCCTRGWCSSLINSAKVSSWIQEGKEASRRWPEVWRSCHSHHPCLTVNQTANAVGISCERTENILQTALKFFYALYICDIFNFIFNIFTQWVLFSLSCTLCILPLFLITPLLLVSRGFYIS